MSLIDRWVMAWSLRSLQRQTQPVDRRLFWSMLAWLLVILVAVVVAGFEDGVWGALARVILGGAAGSAIAAPMGRRLAYRNGYFDGRRKLFDSMAEAKAHGMTPAEWVLAEVERDLNNL